MSMPWRAASATSANGSAPSRRRVERPQEGRAGAAAAMHDDRPRRLAQRRGEGVDIGARQARGGDRDVVVGDAVRLGEAARLGRRELARVFAVGAVVDDRADAGRGERLDIAAAERAGGAEAGGKFGECRRGDDAMLRLRDAGCGQIRSPPPPPSPKKSQPIRRIRRRIVPAAAPDRRRGSRTARAGAGSR